MMSMIRTYTELISLPTFEERFKYLKLNGEVGKETFGFDRWLNQNFYHLDHEWKKARREVIIRDCGYDLACEDHPIPNGVRFIIHHMNPISQDDIVNRTRFLLDPEYLITTIDSTHNAIHYGDESLLRYKPIERIPNDTCPWR